MKKLLLVLALVVGCISSVSAQEVISALRHYAPSGSNIQYVGERTFNTSSTQTSLAGAYTCNSTSNRLIVVGEYQNTSATDIVLSDTGSQAAGATVMLASTVQSTVVRKFWNMGCASGSNTITITESGAGAAAGILLAVQEYSGLSTLAGSHTTNSMGATLTYTASGTATSNCSLAFVYVAVSNEQNDFHAMNAGWNYRYTEIGNGGNGPVNNAYPKFDHLCVPAGTVNFTATSSASTPAGSFANMFIVPGIAATSPNWNPSFLQANSACGASAVTLAHSVTSGDLITVAFGSEATGNAPSSITDNLGTPTTYTLRVNKVFGSTNAIWIYTGVAAVSGTPTITANGSGFSSQCIQAAEFAGPAGTYTDNGGQTSSSGSMTWSQTASTANSIIYAACRGWHATTTFQMTGVGFSATSQANGNDAIGGSWARTVSTAGATPIFAVSTTDNNVCASIVVH